VSKQKKRKNLWVANRNSFVKWLITFPPPSDAANTERLFQFAREFLAATEREDLFRIVETRPPYVFHAADGLNYADYMQQTAAQTGEIAFFNLGGPYVGAVPKYGQLQTPGRVCYFDAKGNLSDREIENLGFLLKQLRPKDANLNDLWMAPIAPITITGTGAAVPVQASQYRTWDRPYLFISLYTDIWFPWVWGAMEDIQAKSVQRLHDNRELAFCHTPRLNRFLASAHEITLELGGNWEVDWPEIPKFYAEMVTENGILLDVP
jgi:hypothetical protein